MFCLLLAGQQGKEEHSVSGTSLEPAQEQQIGTSVAVHREQIAKAPFKDGSECRSVSLWLLIYHLH